MAEAGEPAAEPPKETGVLQPEAWCEFSAGAGEAVAEGGLEPGVCRPYCAPG